MGSSSRLSKTKSAKRRGFINKSFASTNKKIEYCTEPAEDMESDIVVDGTVNMSSSAMKLDISSDEEEVGETSGFNMFINSDVLMSLMVMLCRCPDCCGSVNMIYEPTKKRGLALFFTIQCSDCSWKNTFCSSHERDTGKTGRKSYDFNMRLIIAFREMGLGYSSMATFCNIMNMPPPMSRSSFENLQSELHIAYVKTARESMKNAADDIRKGELKQDFDSETPVNTTASFDGSWQRRGYASLNGVITAISFGKCVDYEVLSKHCKSCQIWERKKDSDGYNDWLLRHVCPINHTGSSGAMESKGAVRIFARSLQQNKLRYVTYIGDGDTKSFQDVQASDPYQGINIVKGECVGHVQKRVGTRLRKLKERCRGKVLSDGKKLFGKGRLTEKAINTLQNYYGIAIRSNAGDLYGMKKSVAAIIHHCSVCKTKDFQHMYCPTTENTWCRYQSDILTGKDTYKHKPLLPEAVSNEIKHLFSYKDLGSDELLSKCLHGKTQNANESINNVIWTRCPKRIYVGRQVLEMGVSSAVINFNEGFKGLRGVFEKVFIDVGLHAKMGLKNRDRQRLREMQRKSSGPCKTQRKRLRNRKKGFEDKHSEKEGTTYACGAFS